MDSMKSEQMIGAGLISQTLELSISHPGMELQALKRVRKEKETPLDFAGGMSNTMNPTMAQMASLMGASKPQRPVTNPVGSQMPGMMNRQAGGASGGVGNMSEEEYVRVWETYSKSMGTSFDPNTVRGWYRQHKQTSSGKK